MQAVTVDAGSIWRERRTTDDVRSTSSRPPGVKSLKNAESPQQLVEKKEPQHRPHLKSPAADPAQRNQAASTGSMVGSRDRAISYHPLVAPALALTMVQQHGRRDRPPGHAVQRQLEQAIASCWKRGEGEKLHGKQRATAVACRTPPASWVCRLVIQGTLQVRPTYMIWLSRLAPNGVRPQPSAWHPETSPAADPWRSAYGSQLWWKKVGGPLVCRADQDVGF